MSQPKADCEALMNAVLPFAEQMLRHHGEFFPFGGAKRMTLFNGLVKLRHDRKTR